MAQMKIFWWLLGFCFLIFLAFWSLHWVKELSFTESRMQFSSEKALPTPTIVVRPVQTMLFVPYWTLAQNTSMQKYDSLIYFGITADDSGITKSDTGYKQIPGFMQIANQTSGKKLLTLSLVNQKINEEILQNKQLQGKIIDQTISLAKQYGFDGIVLDLEYNALPFDSVLAITTNFTKDFVQKTHEQNLVFYQAIYGDAFYRSRPFDVEKLAKIVDGILVMSYDLHKAHGDPGPNFPMQGNDYTFPQMTSDFLAKVPPEKLTVNFGMYGYDWTVDSKGQSIGQAESLTTNQILQKFIARCEFKNCNVDGGNQGQAHVTYTDAQGQNHIVWFENLTSILPKQEFLKRKGIFSTAFWANGYF